MHDENLMDLDDVAELEWLERFACPPPREVLCYFLESAYEAGRLFLTTGRLQSRARLYDFLEDGRRILAVEEIFHEPENG